MFEQVKIILINTTHPGNIGAVARAMKNMGLQKLCLVAPKIFPSEEAIARSSGAEDLLSNVLVVPSLKEALADCHWVGGLSARIRKIPLPTLTSRTAAVEILRKCQKDPHQKIALLFGQEQSGLNNEDLAQCHVQIVIPANENFASLNLAQAVQIMVYELRMALSENHHAVIEETTAKKEDREDYKTLEALATVEEMEGFYTQLTETLIHIQFLNPKAPGHLMRYLRRLYARSRITKLELNILRGILTAIRNKM